MLNAGALPRRWPWLAALAIVLYMICLAATAPASVAAWALERLTGGTVSLLGTTEGFWRGQAASIHVRTGGSSTQTFSQIRWALNGWRLFHGELALDLAVNDPQAKGRATLAWRPALLRLSSASLDLAPSVVAPYFPVLHVLSPQGQLALQTEDLALRPGGFSGKADLEWKNAATALSPVDPLGRYRVRANAAGAQAQFDVDTPEGPLQISGRGSWSREAGLRFNGSARAAAGREADLRDLLGLLGPDGGGGVHSLRLGP